MKKAKKAHAMDDNFGTTYCGRALSSGSGLRIVGREQLKELAVTGEACRWCLTTMKATLRFIGGVEEE